jgi:hypothetical protein
MHVATTSLLRDSYHHSSKCFQFYSFTVSTYFTYSIEFIVHWIYVVVVHISVLLYLVYYSFHSTHKSISGAGTLAQVLEEMEFWVALTPKRHTSWESWHLGQENMPRIFSKHEVKHGIEVTKRRGAPKRLGCIDMRIPPKVESYQSQGI